VAKPRAAYGAGSMTERAPGVWRLRVMTDRGQVERILRGGQRGARKALTDLAGESPVVTTSDTPERTFGQLLDAWQHIEARGSVTMGDSARCERSICQARCRRKRATVGVVKLLGGQIGDPDGTQPWSDPSFDLPSVLVDGLRRPAVRARRYNVSGCRPNRVAACRIEMRSGATVSAMRPLLKAPLHRLQVVRPDVRGRPGTPRP